MGDRQIVLDDLVALDLPVPPMLEAALGYEGPARWVGFFWQYDDARAHDGRFDLPADWYAWRVFTEHLAVMAVLTPFNFGSEVKGTHILLLDRADRRLYAAATATALAFLTAQWTPTGDLPAAELQQLAELPDLDLMTEASRFQAVPLSPALAAEVSARMQRAAANYAALASWLAEHLPKPDPAAVRATMEQALAACQVAAVSVPVFAAIGYQPFVAIGYQRAVRRPASRLGRQPRSFHDPVVCPRFFTLSRCCGAPPARTAPALVRGSSAP